MCRRALAGYKNPESKHTLSATYGLGIILERRGKLGEAEIYASRSAIRTQGDLRRRSSVDEGYGKGVERILQGTERAGGSRGCAAI